MRNITEAFKPDTIFWKVNPQFLATSPFKELYNSDKSRNKKNSSNIMWAISLCYHPESDIYYMSDKENRVFDMIKDKSFKLDDYFNHIEVFKDMCLSQAQKSLISWEEFMVKRDKFIKTQEYNMDTGLDLDKMASATAKLYQDYFKIKKEVDEEKLSNKTGRGGKQLSLSDAGEI